MSTFSLQESLTLFKLTDGDEMQSILYVFNTEYKILHSGCKCVQKRPTRNISSNSVAWCFRAPWAASMNLELLGGAKSNGLQNERTDLGQC